MEYRLAPEHSLPIAYEDSWAALQWVASHSIDNGSTVEKEPWLANHCDFKRLFTGGDSAGANIAHNVTMRAGVEVLHGGVRILGASFTHPLFLGSKPKRPENSSVEEESLSPSSFWDYIYAEAPGGIDNPVINPFFPGAPSLAGLGCSRLLVSVAEKDGLRDVGVCYYNALKETGWKGDLMELVEVEGEDHAFQILNFGSENSKNLIKRLASFLLK